MSSVLPARGLVPLVLWCEPNLRRRVQRQAQRRGLESSQFAAELLELGLAHTPRLGRPAEAKRHLRLIGPVRPEPV